MSQRQRGPFNMDKVTGFIWIEQSVLSRQVGSPSESGQFELLVN
jgi:hypothetical protein